MELQDKQVVVLGAGSSGKSAARLCRHKGARVRLVEQSLSCVAPWEQSTLQQLGISLELGKHYPDQLAGA
ncbi:MAG: UDP-N-acetylmuramoylalanine--D-glutamate ligase, partial [Desulfohalobiaceae bacterium]